MLLDQFTCKVKSIGPPTGCIKRTSSRNSLHEGFLYNNVVSTSNTASFKRF